MEPEIQITQIEKDADDDFGDFEEPNTVADDFGDFTEPVLTAPEPEASKTVYIIPDSNQDMENKVSQLLGGYVDDFSAVYKQFALAPDVDPPVPFESPMWTRIIQDKGFKPFSWRHSQIKSDFLSCLMPEEVAHIPEIPKEEIIVRSVDEMKGDPRETDKLNAQMLVEVGEDQIRLKTSTELEAYLEQLKAYQTIMQEQVNYWLDSKEKLIMDAEMHNKMIASLVNFAQQQQEGPKQGKKKK